MSTTVCVGERSRQERQRVDDCHPVACPRARHSRSGAGRWLQPHRSLSDAKEWSTSTSRENLSASGITLQATSVDMPGRSWHERCAIIRAPSSGGLLIWPTTLLTPLVHYQSRGRTPPRTPGRGRGSLIMLRMKIIWFLMSSKYLWRYSCIMKSTGSVVTYLICEF